MDIKEIQEKKATLEATIRDMIADFEDETGVKVDFIGFAESTQYIVGMPPITSKWFKISVTI